MFRYQHVLLMCVLLTSGVATGQVYNVPFSPSAGIDPVFQLTFNSAEGDDDCLNHGAGATTANFDCNCTDGDGCAPEEGDGALQHDSGGAAKENTDWCAAFAPALDDFWVRWWYYVDETANTPNIFILSFRTGGACDGIPGGYGILLTVPASDRFDLQCDGNFVNADNTYTDKTWSEYLVHVDLDAGDVFLWRDDFTGAPDWSCTAGVGGDSGFDGIRIQGRAVATGPDEVRWDNIRVYDEDPR